MRSLIPLLVAGTPQAYAGEPATDDADGDIVVEGSADPANPRTAAASVTVVRIDERVSDGEDLADVVARAPGTTIRRLGGLGGFSAVSLRGSALRQVQVFVDGLPLNPDGSSAVNLAELPLDAFEQVEVWRGAGPASLAAAPLGGVVSLQSRRDPQVPLSVSAGLGSWGSATGGIRGSDARGPVEVLGSVSGLTSRADFVTFDDRGTPFVRTDDRLERRAGNDRHQLAGLLRLRSTAGREWSALGVLTAREEGVPGAFGSAPDGRLRTTWGLASARVSLSSLSHGRVWAQSRDERRTPADGMVQTDRFTQAGVHLHGRLPLTERTSLGATGQCRADHRGTDGATDPALRGTATMVLDAHHATDRFSVDPVVHAQVWGERIKGEGARRAAINPRVSARYSIGQNWIVHAAGGRAVRPPDFLELFGDRGTVQGRTDLLPERAWWADAGLRWLPGPVSVEASLFVNDAADRIVFAQAEPRILVPINVDRSRTLGAEIGVDANIGEIADGRIATTLTHARILDGNGGRLPRIPSLAAHLDLGLKLGDRARLSYRFDAIGDTPWDEGTINVAPPRLLHAVGARVEVGPGWPTLSLDVRNLANTLVQPMDADQARPGGTRVLRPLTDFAGYPLPGRTVLISARWTPGDLP